MAFASPQGQRGDFKTPRGRGRGRSTSRGGFGPSDQHEEGKPSAQAFSDTFTNERDQNDAKRRAIKGIPGTPNIRGTGTSRGGRGETRGHNKQNRSTPEQSYLNAPVNPASAHNSMTTMLSTSANSHPFATLNSGSLNAFGNPQSQTSSSIFGASQIPPSPTSNPFTQPLGSSSNTFGNSQSQSSSTVFGSATQSLPSMTTNPFTQPAQTNVSVFGKSTSSTSATANPFGSPSLGSSALLKNPFARSPDTSSSVTHVKTIPPFSAKPTTEGLLNPGPFSATTSINGADKFGASPSTQLIPTTPSLNGANKFGASPSTQSISATLTPTLKASIAKPSKRVPVPASNNSQKANPSLSNSKPVATSEESSKSSELLARKVNDVLRIKKIRPPQWPGVDPDDVRDEKQIKEINTVYFRAYQTYQEKVRVALIAAGLIDDPDVPKRLADALDFKGTCEEMCSQMEKADRLQTDRLDMAEKRHHPDGTVSKWPVMDRMIKRNARSAAGQPAPLPEDIRSVAALRRTVDYMFNNILAEFDLPSVYGFLWDRERAVRRDFVFHSTMSTSEMIDQIYCLEHIVRFHAVAAHEMAGHVATLESKSRAAAYSQQQEYEQMGKALLSLMHAYDDCRTRGIECENEIEFRSYHILCSARDRNHPNILEEVQNWGWKYWGESEEIQRAVSLLEALRNSWDLYGPFNKKEETDIALNGFSRFFSIVKDKEVSFTMACMAETFFGEVRTSMLRAILQAYRKQRDQTKDLTLTRLNQYFCFDDESQLREFIELHNVNVERNGEEYHLLFEQAARFQESTPQYFSRDIVERKRGQHSIPQVISEVVYDVSDEHPTIKGSEEDESLFVIDDSITQPLRQPAVDYTDISTEESINGDAESIQPPLEPVAGSKSTSLFDRIGSPRPFGNNFFSPQSETAPSSPAFPPTAEAAKIPATQSPVQTNFSCTKQAVASSPLPVQDQFRPKTADQLAASVTIPQESNSVQTPISSSPFSFLKQPAPEKESSAVAPVSVSKDSSSQQFPTQSPLPNVLAPTASPKSAFFLANTAPSMSSQPQHSMQFSASINQAAIANEQTGVTKDQTEAPAQTLVSSPDLAQSHIFNKAPQPFIPASSSLTPSSIEQAAALIPTPSQVQADLQLAKDAREKKINAVAEWYATGEDGLVPQFVAHQVELLLHQVARFHVEEEKQRIAQEAEQKSREEADGFRCHSLAKKYIALWREKARLERLRRRGREARQARREHAEARRAAKETRDASLVDDFRASVASTASRRRSRDSLESLLNETGILNGVHDADGEIRAVTQSGDSGWAHKRQRSEKSTSSLKSSTVQTAHHKRGQSENPLRRSLMSDPSYMQGSSRIHFMPNYTINDDSRSRVSGVQTDYFRLKARGITTLSDGTPLASSVARSTITKKRSLEEFKKPSTPRHLKASAVTQSVPAKSTKFRSSEDDTQALKAKAKALMEDDSRKRTQKRAYVDDDDLFARAKRVREQMDEGADWFKRQVEKMSRSVS